MEHEEKDNFSSCSYFKGSSISPRFYFLVNNYPFLILQKWAVVALPPIFAKSKGVVSNRRVF
ncbi:MAG: hypothetical protein SNJ29_04025 [Rikenellaceae bacterium]